MQLEWNEIPGGGQVSLNYFERIINSYVVRVTDRDLKLISRISTDNQKAAYEIYNRELTPRGVGKMKFVVEERFTNDLGITFEKAYGGGHGEPYTYLYFMRKDNSQSVFELIEKDRYEIAQGQYKAAFMERMAGKTD
jgi:hypothetical protein